MSKLADEWDRGYVPFVFVEQSAQADEERKEQIHAFTYDAGVIIGAIKQCLDGWQGYRVLPVRVDEHYTNMVRVESPAGRMYLVEVTPLNY